MNKFSAVLFVTLILSPFSYGEVLDKQYTMEQFIHDVREDAVFSIADTLKLVTYKNTDTGDFYDYALQGVFLNYIKAKRIKLNDDEYPQLRTIATLYEKKTAQQNFAVTLNGIKKILSEDKKNYSQCVIGFCLITQIMPNRKNLTATDIDFFINFYKCTNSKLLQSAIYSAVLNGDSAIKYKETIFKYGNYSDIFSVLTSLINTTKGDEQEMWKIRLKELGIKSPELKQKIDSYLQYK